MRIALSLLDSKGLNSPEVIVGLTAMGILLAAIIIGFFYKKYKSKHLN